MSTYISIRQLYKKALAINEKNDSEDNLTTINVDKELIDFNNFPISQTQTAEITLLNMGNNLLVVSNVVSSCDCIKVEYDKQPINPKQKISLKISFNAENKGYFRKALNIYCNAKESPISIKIHGYVE